MQCSGGDRECGGGGRQQHSGGSGGRRVVVGTECRVVAKRGAVGAEGGVQGQSK